MNKKLARNLAILLTAFSLPALIYWLFGNDYPTHRGQALGLMLLSQSISALVSALMISISESQRD